MPRHPSCFFVRRTLGLAASGVAFLAAACEPSGDRSHEETGAPAAFAPDAGSASAPDAAPGPDADAAPALSARDLELARMQAHLDSLYAQSSVVHRFTTALGDDVDCVPFDKQPGFAQVGSLDGAAPVLDAPARLGTPSSSAGFGDGVDAAGNARSCPASSVPIRRRTIEDLARFATLEDFLAKVPAHVLDLVDGFAFSHEHGAHTVAVPNWGGQTTLNVWNPAVEPNDSSISQLWVHRGAGPDHQSVEAGYIADPNHNRGDAQSRLFIYSTTDNYNVLNSANCYDLTCKAFVQLANTHVLIGGRFDRTSVANGEQREFTLRWQFCPATECKAWEGWWLRYDGGATDEWVGFYPRSRYSANGLHDQGDNLDFGGEVAFKRAAAHTTTNMGSGELPALGFGAAAYQTNLLGITTGHAWATLGAMRDIMPAPGCYQVGPIQTVGAAQKRQAEQQFFFGGTGYSEACK
jgi:hypothetical protein